MGNSANIYIEMTNPIHGGPEWEFGRCLWSPEKSRSNSDRWSNMRELKKGDIIIHSLKQNGGHEFVGTSRVKSEYVILDFEPTIPGKWKGYGTYYRVDLEDFTKFKEPIKMKKIINERKEELKKYSGSFYTSKLEPAEKYLSKVDVEVYNILQEYFYIAEEEIEEKINKTRKRSSVVTRIIRDTNIVNELKESTRGKCQICGKQIVTSNGKVYSEGHHLVPLGGIHSGPDVKGNIIILCPNHHVEFDYGCIAINPRTMRIQHIDKSNEYNESELAYIRDDIKSEYIKYHYNKIFNKMK